MNRVLLRTVISLLLVNIVVVLSAKAEYDDDYWWNKEDIVSAIDFIGCWQDYPILGNSLGETLNFADDGSFIHLFGDPIDPRVCQLGTWEYEDGMLVISITSQIVNEGGEIENIPDAICIAGGHDREQIISPPLASEYDPIDLMVHYDDSIVSTNPDSRGEITPKLAMSIGNATYWKILDHPLTRNGKVQENYESDDIRD